ncbi:hypothetical protein [Methanosarcina barkeri]|uniref:Uncharacterized protein n=1 Tax=Methanosarcina barkeri CM1 TaxID=796385 RepID=A0A0G3CBI9_METBA|nr:hypothetical protein [Methanosarcina barkeri]AKJ39361.1 hypothetical protein MCM1_2344 [Methanosarcina barkeri CM1]
MKQIHVDNGQIGGVIQVVIQSMFLCNFITFVNTTLTVYNQFLKNYISLYTGILLICFASALWWGVYDIVTFPSMLQYGNRQAWVHESPIKKEFERLNQKIDKLNTEIQNYQEG